MKLRPENKFLAAALSVIAVGAAAGYIAIIAPTYDAENRIPPPPDRFLAAAPAEDPAPLYTLDADPEPEAPLPETEAPAPETEATPPETEAPAPETEATPPETEAPAPVILALDADPDSEDLPEVSRGVPDAEELVLLDPAGYYVVNTSSGIIHEPGCSHLKTLKDQNRSGTDHPDELMEAYPATYRWCKDCHE